MPFSSLEFEEEKTNPFWKNEMRKNYPRQIHFHELNIVERKAIWATEMDSFTDRSNWFDPIDNRHERTMVRGVASDGTERESGMEWEKDPKVICNKV